MQVSFCFCKTCICLKTLENIQISVNMIDRLDITDEYSVKCDFILNTVIFIDAALNISLRKSWKCDVLWFYLFDQGVPNETKGMINLKRKAYLARVQVYYIVLTYMITSENIMLFTVCTEQMRSPYTEHAASGLPDPTQLEWEIVTECLLAHSMVITMYMHDIYMYLN